MEKLRTKIQLDDGASEPKYQNERDACLDLCSNMDVTILPGRHALIKTGVHIEIPEGYEIQIRSRSGLAYKHGVCVLNAPGIIDSGYTGDIGAILANFGEEEFVIKKGDRIAQMSFAKVIKTSFDVVLELEKAGRADNGFGSTGK